MADSPNQDSRPKSPLKLNTNSEESEKHIEIEKKN